MLYVKLPNKLKGLLELEEDVITWHKLKELIQRRADIVIDKDLLKGCEFKSQLSTVNGNNRTISVKEYARLTGTVTTPTLSSDLHQLRTDLAELRRESTWLLNALLSVIGTGGFIYFVAAFYLERVEARVIVSLLGALAIFFIEVILYIIREA